ncbi:putative F-box/LRR-repeat protein 23 [Olea europaea var. sylvestris]|uniref:putative F-box/LRR-repeat protein 23 n=1 Tax=Olea europaea var. sylvestris TaxID=158386 RepID=UPI000C1D1055|nr:putative F-box/LRR-repeat protein 23 [Olea europaea var. sylvestris]
MSMNNTSAFRSSSMRLLSLKLCHYALLPLLIDSPIDLGRDHDEAYWGAFVCLLVLVGGEVAWHHDDQLAQSQQPMREPRFWAVAQTPRPALSSQLRCLRLGGCSEVSGDGLSEAAKGFPLLEELHFVFVKNCNEGIEAIGRSCPKLRSFTLSESGYKHPQLLCDADALAIAKSMPGLHRLQLLGNNMTNEGLQAILDGCPLLELLDIRKCLNVDLSGELGKRITQKIKDFKRPDDSMEDCEWDPEIFDCDEYDEDYYRSSEISEFSLDNYYDYDDYLHYSGSDYDSDGGVDPYFYFD